ncbi:MAG: hypothetical protein AAF492_00110 [Verrucomicrobiota bacterium]
MYDTQLPLVDLYRALAEYTGVDAYSDVLESWSDNNPAELNWIANFEHRTKDDWSAATDEDECRLYTLFRVTSLLLLCFQTGRADGIDDQGPALPLEGIQIFLEQLGFHVPDVRDYHPFYHEILSVAQAERHDEPVEITRVHWPCFMLGDMIFCRSGVSVSGGRSHVIKEIAESSMLYWTFRRKDRPYNDPSHGWGHNSQWRTAHRRDYRTKDAYHFNVGGCASLNDPKVTVDDVPHSSMIELVRNRCLITTPIDDSDLYPYPYFYTEDV